MRVKITTDKNGRIVKYEPVRIDRGQGDLAVIDMPAPSGLMVHVDGLAELDAPAPPFSEPDTGDRIDPGSTAGKILEDLRRSARTVPKPADTLADLRELEETIRAQTTERYPLDVVSDELATLRTKLSAAVFGAFDEAPRSRLIPWSDDGIAFVRNAVDRAIAAHGDAMVQGRGTLMVGVDPAFGEDATIYAVTDRATGKVVDVRADYKSLETRALEESNRSYFQAMMAEGQHIPGGMSVDRFGQRYDTYVGVPSAPEYTKEQRDKDRMLHARANPGGSKGDRAKRKAAKTARRKAAKTARRKNRQ